MLKSLSTFTIYSLLKQAISRREFCYNVYSRQHGHMGIATKEAKKKSTYARDWQRYNILVDLLEYSLVERMGETHDYTLCRKCGMRSYNGYGDFQHFHDCERRSSWQDYLAGEYKLKSGKRVRFIGYKNNGDLLALDLFGHDKKTWWVNVLDIQKQLW